MKSRPIFPLKPRILISAFACSPFHGSEKGVGWNIISRLDPDLDITVLYGDLKGGRQSHRELQQYFHDNPAPKNVRFEYVPPTRHIEALEYIHRFSILWMLYYIGYTSWQRTAWLYARQLHKNKSFTVSHEFTYLSYRTPGYLHNLNIPHIWGPISGSMNIPWRFYRSFGVRELFHPLSRDFVNSIQKHTSHACRSAARKAARIFAGSPEDKLLIRRWTGNDPELMIETGTDPSFPCRMRVNQDRPLKIIWSGIFQPRKALPLLFEALQMLPQGARWELDIIGDGPMSPFWKKLGLRLLNSGTIRWHGQVPKREALHIMEQGDVLVHTSLKESSTTVILEALSFGMPVICHDCGGMAVAVNEKCGLKIPAIDRETSVKGFSQAICRLAHSERQLLSELSAGAAKRRDELTWARNAARLSSSYRKFTDINQE